MSKLWGTEVGFFPTSQDSKDQAVELILLESANMCWRLRIFIVIWAGISHATKHTDLNPCLPRAVSAQGMRVPRAKAVCAGLSAMLLWKTWGYHKHFVALMQSKLSAADHSH